MRISKSKLIIGKLIQEKVFVMNISLSELSERMLLKEKTLLLIFEAKKIDLNLLYKFSHILRYDFFSIYSHYLNDNVQFIEKETKVHFSKYNHINYIYEQDEQPLTDSVLL